ncbi:MAG: RNA polymerase sigma factor, partial [Planctomycetia bacterium]
ALAAARGGDRGAFDELVQRHHRRVFRLAVKLLGDEEAALDAAQEAFLRAWRALAGFEGQSLFTTWLTRITINTCRNELRRRASPKHARPASLDVPGPQGEGTLGEALPAADDPPLGRLTGRELRVAFLQALQRLDPGEREVLVLKEVEGLPYEAIAELLDVPVGTVRSRLHRARAALRQRMGEA